MGKKNDAALIVELERIKTKVRKTRAHYSLFVCNEANNGAYGDTIRRMVRRHIGYAPTMTRFLADKNVKGAYGSNSSKIANAYRLLMLDNMIKWVKTGDYE